MTLFCGDHLGFEPILFFSNYLFSLGFKPVLNDFHYDFAWIIDEADGPEVLVELILPCLGSVIIVIVSRCWFISLCEAGIKWTYSQAN